MDLTLAEFADAVGPAGEVTIAGEGTRGGPVDSVRCVRAPDGLVSIDPAEMVVRCGAATPVDELSAALAEHRQSVALPAGGTVGGALAVGRSSPRRLGEGAMRDALLQVSYVSAVGEVVTAGGPTVKNVSGFDLCRLLVGSRGTLGFLGEVILRTRPLPIIGQWFMSDTDPWHLLAELYRPTSLLWDGGSCHVLLEGHPDDVAEQARRHGLAAVEGPPLLPTGGRWSLPASELASLGTSDARFIAEIGVGVVHHSEPAPPRAASAAVVALHARLKQEFDPGARLNPGVSALRG
ncbi:MAG: FAD-binding protein [Acidimicrobiia bacterium]|nr:FAD-binding protein [Acidimicrobiia bacterium]